MELFDQIRAFVEAAEARASDYLNKGADIFDGIGDYLRSLASGAKFAAGPDDATLNDLEARARALKAVGDSHTDPNPKKIDPATIALIVTAVIELIKFLRERRKS